MASTITTTCDKCGQTIASGRVRLDVQSGPLRRKVLVIDLCETHAEELRAWLPHLNTAVNVAAAEPTDDRD